MRLRVADRGDVAILAAVHAVAFDQPWPPEAFGELFASPGVFALGATDDVMVGLVLMRAVAGEAEVLTLAVAPTHRRRGVARALLVAGLELASGLGAQAVFLEVAADNGAALDLYRAAGFDAVGRRAGYYPREQGPAADALVLRRALNSPTP